MVTIFSVLTLFIVVYLLYQIALPFFLAFFTILFGDSGDDQSK